jgi:two-component system, response regulator YesN
MKTKVLLVDDEKLERVLIRKGYDWEGNGFEIIGEASSGEEALEFFDIQEPDIVFTDINMPHMDGLALTEKIKERSLKCRVVIITGYREFEYARRALQLGVKDFILKPVHISDISELANSIKEEIQHEEGLNEEYLRLRENATTNRDVVIESFLQRLVENRIEEEEAIHKLKLYSFDKLLNNCVCIDIKPHMEQDNGKEETLDTSNEIIKLVQNTQGESVLSFVHYLGNVLIYLATTDLVQAKRIAMESKICINRQLKLEVEIGISQIQEGFKGISKAYRQAKRAISASVILGRNSCITFEEYAKIKEKNQGIVHVDWNDFVFNVESCLENKVEEHINHFTEAMKKGGITDTGYLKLMAMNMLSKSASVLTRQGKSLGQFFGENYLYEEIAKIETVEEMNDCLKKMIKEILTYIDSRRNKKSNKLVEQSLAYIDANLYDTLLTLKTVAKKVYTNESYLSRVFKKEVGESLIEYITRKRIEQSILLLNTTDYKVYEIAEKIGFSNPHYFSICFKKHIGVTIKEYKKPKF